MSDLALSVNQKSAEESAGFEQWGALIASEALLLAQAGGAAVSDASPSAPGNAGEAAPAAADPSGAGGGAANPGGVHWGWYAAGGLAIAAGAAAGGGKDDKDTTAPSLVVTDGTSGVTNAPVTYTFTFSEPVTGFTADDVTVTHGSKGAFSGSGAVYTLVVTPDQGAEGSLAVAVAAGAANDAAGNRSIAAAAADQAIDTKAPTLTISDDVAGVASGAVTYTFTFSEAVQGFTAADINVGNAEKGAFSGSGAVYTLVVAPGANTAGNISIDVAAGAASDTAGNATSAASDVQAFDTVHRSYVLGQSVIDLGNYGQLIAPFQVDGGKWYYYWDRSANGSATDNGSLNDGKDWTTHNVLDGLFKQDVNGVVSNAGITDSTYRYALFNGVRVALPTVGDLLDSGPRTPTTVGGNDPNPTYDDLLAAWDAVNGTPSGWRAMFYWSANPAANAPGMHLVVDFRDGTVSPTSDFAMGAWVALQVL